MPLSIVDPHSGYEQYLIELIIIQFKNQKKNLKFFVHYDDCKNFVDGQRHWNFKKSFADK